MEEKKGGPRGKFDEIQKMRRIVKMEYTLQRAHTSRAEIPYQANISQFACTTAACCRFCRNSHISLFSISSASFFSSRILKPDADADVEAAVALEKVEVGLIGIFLLPKTGGARRMGRKRAVEHGRVSLGLG